MLNVGDTSCLVVTVPYTQLSVQWRDIIELMVFSVPGLKFKVQRETRSVEVKIKNILFNRNGTATVVFSKLGWLGTEYEPAIIKERIRQLLDTRHY